MMKLSKNIVPDILKRYYLIKKTMNSSLEDISKAKKIKLAVVGG